MKRLLILSLMLVLVVPLYAERIKVRMLFSTVEVDTLFRPWTQEIEHKEYFQRPDTAILESKITPDVPDTLVAMVKDSVMWTEYIPRVDTLTARELAIQDKRMGHFRASSATRVVLGYTTDNPDALADTVRLKVIAKAFKGVKFWTEKEENLEAVAK